MKQSLILAVQITEELFNVLDIHLDRRWQNVGIIAGLRCLFLFVDLHLLHIGELLFDEFQGINLVQRFDMNVHAEKILHFKEILENFIGQFSGEDIHTPHSAVGIADLKITLIEFERGRTDEILCVHSCPQHFTPIEKKWGISVRVQGIIQSFKSLLAVQYLSINAKGFEALGAKVTYDKACYTIEAKKLKGAKIFLDIASVGATINIMMAAVYAEGRTTIENAAKAPEIIDIATLLNKMGARIRGAGTNVIKIDGVKSLSGCFHEIIPDRIEAGTFIIIAAAMAKRMVINNIIPQHLEALLSKLKEMGVNMEVGIDRVIIERSENLKSVDITTKPYPGFATDLQQPLTALLTQAEGEGRINETIYIERFKHCLELEKMGADIELIPAGAIIKGPTKLYGTSVSATDLRCGAAMIVAGLIAEGVTSIKNVYHIDRGYSEIDKKLSMLGAKIWRENI